MKYRDTKIAIGGLMRCCIETINDYVDAHGDEEFEPVESGGLTLECKYEKPGNAKVILIGSIWRWNHA